MKFKVSILNFLMLAALSFVPLHIAYSQTASILPPAKTTFFDKNGNPLAFGTAEFYIPGTTTPKTTWQNSTKTISNTNPVTLDSAGRGLILGDGDYRQIIRDKNGNLIWDQITSSTGTSSSGGGGTPTVGDGDPVGIIKAWASFIAPYQYVFAYGQELPRSSYPEALAALTMSQNVSCTLGSSTLSGLSDTSQIPIGAKIETACLNAGSTVVSKTVNTVVVSSTAIISSTNSARFFPFGNGDGVNTFNIPDLRGRVIAGRDNMGSIPANRLNLATGLGSIGGDQSYLLPQSGLPNVSPVFTGNSMTTSVSLPNVPFGDRLVQVNAPASSGVYGLADNTGVGLAVNTAPFTPSGTISSLNGNVTQTSIPTIQPTQSYNYIIKIIPDTNPNSYFGVASIGGMYGVIQCGDGLNCVGNTISVSSSMTGVSDIQGMTGSINCGSGLSCTGNTLIANGGLKNIYNVTDYGAVCDNVIDDTNAIKNALSSIPSGSTLIFPASSCLVASGATISGKPVSITIDKPVHISFPSGGGIHQTYFGALFNIESDNVTIDGAAGASLVGPSVTYEYVGFSNAITTNNYKTTNIRRTNITIRNISITKFSAFAIALWYCDNCIIENTQINDVRYGGIGCFACYRTLVNKNIITNVWSSTSPSGGPVNIGDHYGITISSDDTDLPSIDAIVSNNIVKNVPAWQCYDTHNGNNVLFIGNEGIDCLLGLSAGTTSLTSGATTNRVSIIDNTFKCTDLNSPVYPGGPATSMTSAGVRVTGLNDSSFATMITIKANTIVNCGSSNYAVAGNYGNIHLLWAVGVNVEGNNIYLGRYRGVTVQSSVWGSIQNNTISLLQAGPIGDGAYLFDVTGTGNILNIGGTTAFGTGYYGYKLVAQGAGYQIGISRNNILSGATALYVGSSVSNRTDLGATAP